MSRNKPLYDLLSLIATWLETYPTTPSLEEEILSMVCMDDSAFDRRKAEKPGGSFHVIICPPASFLKNIDSKANLDIIWQLALLQRNDFILRSPKGRFDVRTRQGKVLLTALANELLILRNPLVAKHPNIVDLVGVCWDVKNTDEKVMTPVFVMETAGLGNLNVYMKQNPSVSLRERLRLAIQITQGVLMLHDIGVIHCDLKPDNILIFENLASEDLASGDPVSKRLKHGSHRTVAKVSDFDSALLLSEIGERIRIPSGTILWQSPSAKTMLDHRGLVLADLYSLGLLLFVVLSWTEGNMILQEVMKHGYKGFSFEELKDTENIITIVVGMMDQANKSNPEQPRYTADILDLATMLFHFTLSLEASMQLSGVVDVLKLLRVMLHKLFVEKSALDPGFLETMDDFDMDIYLSPEVDRPSDTEIDAIVTLNKADSAEERPSETAKSSREQQARRHPHAQLARTYQLGKQTFPSVEIMGTHFQEGNSNQFLCRTWGTESVVSYNHSFSHLRELPTRVLHQVLQELEFTAEAKDQSTERQRNAAYEFAAFSIGSHQFEKNREIDLAKAAKFLEKAARLGHPEARASLGLVMEGISAPMTTKREEEISWLVQLTGDGSLVARRRLAQLDPEKYQLAMSALRMQVCYNDPMIRSQRENFKTPQDIEHHLFKEDSPHAWQTCSLGIASMCHYVVIVGWADLLTRILKLPDIDVNALDHAGTSLLLRACEVGDLKITESLVKAGAKVDEPSANGLSPFHYLDRFQDETILAVASLLKEAGAPVEAHCIPPERNPPVTDLSDSLKHGTPLLWAVAAQNKPAVQALVDLGADPFDRARDLSDSEHKSGRIDIRTRGRSFSPVHYAARLHLWEILGVLLPELPDGRGHEGLSECTRLEDNFMNVTAMYCALDYASTGLFHRLLTHSKAHTSECLRTIRRLIERGSLTRLKNGIAPVQQDVRFRKLYSPLSVLCRYGQPFLLDWWWEQGEVLRPSREELAEVIQQAINGDDDIMLSFLLPKMMSFSSLSPTDEEFIWKISIQGYKSPRIINRIMQLKDQLEQERRQGLQVQLIRDQKVKVLIGAEPEGPKVRPPRSGDIAVRLVVKPGPGGQSLWEVTGESSNAGEMAGTTDVKNTTEGPDDFEKTLTGGYFAKARELFETGRYDTTSRRTDGVDTTSTLLGRLIKNSKKFSGVDAQIWMLLSLTPTRDEEFFNVLETPTGGLNALQAAVILPEDPILAPRYRNPMAVLDAVLDKYHDEKHLNAVTDEGGQTVLHLAVNSGNLDALKTLAVESDEAEAEMGWNKQDSLGHTPMDAAAVRRRNAAQYLESAGFGRDHPAYRQKFQDFCLNVVEMQKLMRTKGARHRKIVMMVVRTSEENLALVDLKTFHSRPYSVSGIMSARRNPYFEQWLRLEAGGDDVWLMEIADHVSQEQYEAAYNEFVRSMFGSDSDPDK